jgi:hypothetical protein
MRNSRVVLVFNFWGFQLVAVVFLAFCFEEIWVLILMTRIVLVFWQ